MTEPPAKPWRPIFPWHKQDSRWYERCLRDLKHDSEPDAVPTTRKKRNPHHISSATFAIRRNR